MSDRVDPPAEKDDEPEYWRPTDVPRNLTPLERARIAARNARAWADFAVIELGPAPKKGDELVDIGDLGEGEM